MKRKTKQNDTLTSTARNDAIVKSRGRPRKNKLDRQPTVINKKKLLSEKASKKKTQLLKTTSLSPSTRPQRQSVARLESGKEAGILSKIPHPASTKNRKALKKENSNTPINSASKNRRIRSFERALPRKPFHSSRVLVVVDGVFEDIGSISSESIPSPDSDISSVDTASSIRLISLNNEARESSKLNAKSFNRRKGKHKRRGSTKGEDVSIKGNKQANKNDTSEKLDIRSKNEITFPTDNPDDETKGLSDTTSSRRTNGSKEEASDSVAESEDTFEENNNEDGRHLMEIDNNESLEDAEKDCNDDNHRRIRTRSKQKPSSKSRPGSDGAQLDEATMDLLKEYVLNDIEENQQNKMGMYRSEILVENDIELFMARTIRIANEQVRYNGPFATGDQSDSDDDDFSCYMNFLNETEDQAIDQEYFKKIVSKMRNDVRMRDGPNTKDNVDLDKRTLNWVRRKVSQPRKQHEVHDTHVSEYQRKEDHEMQQTSEKCDDSSVKRPNRTVATRGFTRKLAHQGRKHKRSLDILSLALGELGFDISSSGEGIEEHTMTAPNLTQCENSNISVQASDKNVIPQQGNDADVSSQTKAIDKSIFNDNKNQGSIETTYDVERVRFPFRYQTGCRDVSFLTLNCPNSISRLPKKFTTGDSIAASDKLSQQPAPPLVPKVCTSLRQLDLLWRKKESSSKNKNYQNSRKRKRCESEEEVVKRRSIELHPMFKEAGVMHRLPRWHCFVAQDEKMLRSKFDVVDPPMIRHSNDVYGDLCCRLMNCLQGRARLFATCEFFYSDLDRAWYNEDVFSKDAERLGIARGSRLSRNEWKAVRRRITTKPRMFSKKFIRSQLSSRNRYRNFVRKVQGNPVLVGSNSFPYDVCAPIRVGATVNAYSKRYRTIQRGTVLTHDYDTALYLILFESKQFGYELCPDTDVASCGTPNLLHSAHKEAIRGNLLTNGFASPAYGSRLSFTESNPSRSICVNDMMAQNIQHTLCKPAATVTPIDEPVYHGKSDGCSTAATSSRPLIEEIAENEAFLTLVRTIERARVRKKTLIEVIDDTNALLIDQLPFGAEFNPADLNLSKSAQDHLNWLLANLDQTNQVLRTALNHLRNLYGNAYECRSFCDKIENSTVVEEKIEGIMTERTQHDSGSEKTTVNRSDNLGHLISSSLFDQATTVSNEVHNDDGSFLSARLSAVAQMLCISECSEAEVEYKHNYDTAGGTSEALKLALTKFNTMTLPASNTDTYSSGDESSHVLANRNKAIEDLQSAVNILKAELQQASIQNDVASS